jgi:excisionase family DNA binding protein
MHMGEAGMDMQSDERLVAGGLVSIDEAMGFLHVSRSALYALMEQGLLQYVKLGRSRRVPRQALIELAAANLRGGFAAGR